MRRMPGSFFDSNILMYLASGAEAMMTFIGFFR